MNAENSVKLAERARRVDEKARALRRHIIDMTGCKPGKTGHIGGSNSMAEVTAALYFDKMHVNPSDPADPARDYYLLSKGHAALVQYAALAELGFFPVEELTRVKTVGAMLQGHPDRTKTPGVEANTGSLGQGLSIGLGIALGLRLDGSKNHVYVIVGDGELAEGQIWEAAMAASVYGLGNLTAIVDNNGLQATGAVRDRFDSGDIAAKWASFGWNVVEINGHDSAAVLEALDGVETVTDRPTVIIAHTIKGKGVSFAENNVGFHNGSLTPEQFAQAHRELDGEVL